ncbi:MAG: zinc-dependent metalloprotease [Prevotella sp.]|nr:zinc-dependent metalloprotease [Prevotella sp.]
MKHFALAVMAMLMLQSGHCYASGSQLSLVAPDDTPVVKKDSVGPRGPRRPGGPGMGMNGARQDAPKKNPNAYEDLIKKGGSVQEGVFTVRHIEKKWYFEVPENLFGRMFLAVARYVNVPQGFSKLPGEEVSHSAFYLEERDTSTVFMRTFVKTQVADQNEDMSHLVDISTVDPIVMKFDVIGKNKETGARLIDVTNLFLQDNGVTSFANNAKGQLGLGGIAADRTFIDTIKTYPINVEVSTLRTYTAGGGGGGGALGGGQRPSGGGSTPASRTGFITLSLNTSIVLLPETPMQPRLEDERVGYFVDRITKFTDSNPSKHYSIVARYRLEPKDPKAYAAGKLVEPKKQIVYYIDPATPKKWVPYLIAGVNDWNKAFEEAGFKNAIVAKEVPADGSISPDDARYSFIRYLPSETENAYGPHIVDPRSGEIIEAHVCWYHNVMNLVRKWYITQCGPLDKRAQKMQLDDKLMGQLIRFVSSHEVGHTLGLRHNMLSSSFTPVEKLRDKKWVEAHGHTYSIMDYARFNYVAQPEDNIGEKGLFPRINDYDKWAIKWGYQYRPEFKDPYKEKDALRKQVTEMLRKNPHVAYCGDEGRGSDPRSQTESIGDNNMKASDYGIKNLKRIMDNIETWTAQPDGQYDDLNELYRSVKQQYQRYYGHVQRNINGKYRNTIPGMKPYEFAPKAIQKEAIEWMGRNVMEPQIWLYPQSIVDKLGLDPESDMVQLATTTLSYELAPVMIANQYKQGIYPVEEYLNDVFATVWKPINDKDEKINSFRRQVERSYMDRMDAILNPVATQTSGSQGGGAIQTQTNRPVNTTALNSDATLYALLHLNKIEDFVKKQKDLSAKNSINYMHYDDLLLRIKKIREKRENVK